MKKSPAYGRAFFLPQIYLKFHRACDDSHGKLTILSNEFLALRQYSVMFLSVIDSMLPLSVLESCFVLFLNIVIINELSLESN
ncbi:MAG: hypothetical protein COB58_10460 [Thalassobium sp.]|nr:MAG: hypothetical protein COB58_10460 [Thalassobium sp.]